MDVKTFKAYLRDWFAFSFPPHIVFEERKEGIRAFTKPLMSLKLKGWRGVVVYSAHPTHAFALALGRWVGKHRVEVEDPYAVLANRPFPFDGEEGWYVLSYRAFPLGMGRAHRGTMAPRIPLEFARAFKDLPRSGE